MKTDRRGFMQWLSGLGIIGHRTTEFCREVPTLPAPVLRVGNLDCNSVKRVLCDGQVMEGVVAVCPRLGWAESYLIDEEGRIAPSCETSIIRGHFSIEWREGTPQVMKDYWTPEVSE